MARNSHLQPLIDFKDTVVKLLADSEEVMGLIADEPNIDLNDASSEIWESHITDYDYIDDTVLSDGVWILVDIDQVDNSSGTMADLRLYIEVLCSKDYVSLRGGEYRSTKGNRRDNLVCEIDDLVRGNRNLGVGVPILVSVITANTPNGFTGKLLTYDLDNFSERRK